MKNLLIISLVIFAFSSCSPDFTDSDKFQKDKTTLLNKIKWLTENSSDFDSERYNSESMFLLDWSLNQNYTEIFLTYDFIPEFDEQEYKHSNFLLNEILKSQIEYFFMNPKLDLSEDHLTYVLSDVIFFYSILKSKYPQEKSVTLESLSNKNNIHLEKSIRNTEIFKIYLANG